MENSQLLIVTFESFQKLTILKKEEILELALEHIMKKQQELYPILTRIRNYYQIVQIFNVLKHINAILHKITIKFSQVKISESHIVAQQPPSIYAIEKLANDIFYLQKMLPDTIVLHNKVHDNITLDSMYKALEKFEKIQDKLFKK